MSGAIALAAALSRLVTIVCPHCGNKKVVAKGPPVAFRVCARCHKRFVDPPRKGAARRKR